MDERKKEGLWFHVNMEPVLPVPSSFSELAKFIAEHTYGDAGNIKTIIEKFKSISPGIVAIWYNTRYYGTHWLVFQINKVNIPSYNGFRPQRFYEKILIANNNNNVMLFNTHNLTREAIFKRVSGYAVEHLTKKKCVILGCGSIGSRIAETITESGVGNLILVDEDKMRVGNVCQHVLGLNHLGRNKAQALREVLLTKNPYANIQFYCSSVESEAKLGQLVMEGDLIISCLGSDSIESFVNVVSVTYDKPVLYCRTYLHGRIGEIILSNNAPKGSCFQCYLDMDEISIPKIPIIPFEKTVEFDTDCGSAFIPASAVDMDLISLHGARIALSLLEETPNDYNYWLIRGREIQTSEYPDLDPKLQKPFQILNYTISKKNRCFICSREN